MKHQTPFPPRDCWRLALTSSTGAGANKYTFWRRSLVWSSKLKVWLSLKITIPLIGIEICPIEIPTHAHTELSASCLLKYYSRKIGNTAIYCEWLLTPIESLLWVSTCLSTLNKCTHLLPRDNPVSAFIVLIVGMKDLRHKRVKKQFIPGLEPAGGRAAVGCDPRQRGRSLSSPALAVLPSLVWAWLINHSKPL